MSKPIDTDELRARYRSGFMYPDTISDILELCNELDRWRATATLHHYKHGSSMEAGGCDFCAACDAVAALMPEVVDE